MTMKTKLSLLIAAFLFLLSACVVKSLHPFYTEKDLVFIEGLTGIWLDEDSTSWKITRYSAPRSLMGEDVPDNSYRVEILEKDELPYVFHVHLFKLGEMLYFDFFPLSEGVVSDNLAGYHFIPGHSVARVEIFGDENLAFNWFSEDWLKELFEKNRIRISHEVIPVGENEEQYILTASTNELQKFLIKYAKETDPFKDLDRKKINTMDSGKIFNYLSSQFEKQNNSRSDNSFIMNLRKTGL